MNITTITTRTCGPHRVATLADANGTLRNVTIDPRHEARFGAAQAVHLALDDRERIAREELRRVQAIRNALPNRLTEATP